MGLVAATLVTVSVFSPSSVFSQSCGMLTVPVDGPTVRAFAPEGRFGGHWGVDLAAAEGTAVAAADGGVVTFAGPVAEMISVTIDHGGGVRTSYSYLSAVDVITGDLVSAGDIIGRSGVDHGLAALHLSVRIGGRYIDPAPLLGCMAPGAALRLVTETTRPGAYSLLRATRASRRYLRSTSLGASAGG